jgi:small-conductance mechanosensitive channel/CRP-like cAMP-binding protein
MKDPRPRDLVVPAIVLAAAILLPQIDARIALVPEGDASAALRSGAGVLAWVALAWLGARIGDLVLYRAARSAGRRTPYPRLLHDLVRAVLFGAAGVAILVFVFGQAATGFIATSSVLIAVVGFALRNIIGDVFSGIALGVDHPYRIGDWIEMGPTGAGQVVEINWRATRLVTRDGVAIVVPNGLLAGQRLVNYSAPEATFRTSLTVALDPSVPVDRAKRVMLAGAFDAARSFPALRPDVLVKEYGESGVVFLVRFWVPDYGQENSCRDAVASGVLHALRSAGLSFSYPKHDLLVRRGGAIAPDRRPHRDALLAHIDLFQVFDQEELARLARAMTEAFFRTGEVVVSEGEEGSSVFVLAEGALDVAVRDRKGHRSVIDRMVPGDIFGEMSLLTGQKRSATVLAATDAVIYEIRKSDIEPILRRRPEIATSLASLMANRQRQNAERRHALDEAALVAVAPTSDDLLTRIRALFKVH